MGVGKVDYGVSKIRLWQKRHTADTANQTFTHTPYNDWKNKSKIHLHFWMQDFLELFLSLFMNFARCTWAGDFAETCQSWLYFTVVWSLLCTPRGVKTSNMCKKWRKCICKAHAIKIKHWQSCARTHTRARTHT